MLDLYINITHKLHSIIITLVVAVKNFSKLIQDSILIQISIHK